MHSEDFTKLVNITLFYVCLFVILIITLGCTTDKSMVDPLTRKTYPEVAHRLP